MASAYAAAAVQRNGVGTFGLGANNNLFTNTNNKTRHNSIDRGAATTRSALLEEFRYVLLVLNLLISCAQCGKPKNLLSPKNISWNQFFSKTVALTKFFKNKKLEKISVISTLW